MNDPLVTPDWLASRLDEVVILDATYYLPPDPERSRRDFEDARLPGARLFEIDEIADKESDLPHMLPDPIRFGRAMASLGIDGTRPVVVYDRSLNHFSAPRVWFTLKLFGLTDCFVLDGGLSGWTSAGRPAGAGPADWDAAGQRNDWSLDSARVISGALLKDLVSQGGETIIDARARDRFDGIAPEPRPGLKSGRMPGATCVPFTELTDADGRFANVDELRKIFAGQDRGQPILTCGSGMTACVLALGLERIGVTPRLYDGSWAEWGQGSLGVIETG